MAISTKSGWGMSVAALNVTSVVGGTTNAVNANVGVCLSVVAGNAPIRLTKLQWRVDLAPDVAAGTVSVPVRWRVFVIVGPVPQDVTAFQNQAYPAGSHPEVPQLTAQGSPSPMYFDVWLDFSAGDEGLNKLASKDFPDAGPTANPGETLNCIITPLLDAQMDQTLIGASLAIMTLIANGTALSSDQRGNGNDSGTRSLPRYDV